MCVRKKREGVSQAIKRWYDHGSNVYDDDMCVCTHNNLDTIN